MALATVTRVAAVAAHEGPVYAPDEDALYFTTPRPDVAIRRLRLGGEPRVETVVERTANANGMALAADGRLVVCQQGSFDEPAAIVLVDRATGARETLVDEYDGRPLNSPNDVVVKRDGTVWFTDPSYGFLQGFRPVPRNADAVYRHDPATGATNIVAGGFDKPNGLAFSPDERVLYVGDSGAARHVVAYDVSEGRRLVRRRLFAEIAPGYPDGIKVDTAGRVFVSSAAGVQVFDLSGERLELIEVGGEPVNFAFGRGVLFITTDDAVWAAVVPYGGAHP